jgi:hypothetical protein
MDVASFFQLLRRTRQAGDTEASLVPYVQVCNGGA